MTNSTSPAAPTHAVATNASNSVDAHHPAASPSDANVAARSIYEHYVRRQKQLLQQFKQDLADATGVSRPSDMAPNFRDEHEQAARDNFSIANDQYDAGTRGRMSTSVLYVTDDDDGADESSGSSSDGDLPPPTTLSIMPSTNGTASVANKMSAEMSRNVNGAASPPPSRRSVELVAQVVLHALQQNETGADMDMHAGRSVSHKSRRGRVGGFQYAGKRMPVGKPDSDKKVNGTKTTPRVRGSKAEYKRLDELYNKSIHDYYLAETTQSLHGTDDVWEEYTFVVRRTFDWKNEYQKTLVDIKSEELATVLKEALKDVKTVNIRSDKPTLEPNLLFNYLPDLDELLQKERAHPEETQNKNRITHLSILIEYLNTDYAPVAKILYPLLEHHEITYDLLWALFLPNTLVYTICAGSNEPRCLKLDCGQHKQDMRRGKWFQLDCHYVDYDGKTFGEAKAVIEIPAFTGSTRIDSLPAFPLAYHHDEEQVREKLIARGRRFGTFRGTHYKFYEGLAFFKKKKSLVRVNVRARVMVDSLTFRKMNPGYSMSPVKSGMGLQFAAMGDENSDNDDDDGDDDGGQNGIPSFGGGTLAKPLNPISIDLARSALSSRPQRLYKMTGNRMQLIQTGTSADKKPLRAVASLEPEEMSEEQLLICSPTVLGFSLGDKIYLEFSVEHIRNIVFNPTAFDSLVLPEKQKTIVRALVESHTDKSGKKRPGIDDIIKGKGQGLVAVLHGRPGVGKTLTAEGISEYLQRPLYMIGASELGTDPRTLEVQLSRILDVAHGWGAVLLLDEADVFLERRSVHDLMRNSLVSIFLRLLEYFQGILFLTTNRVETFDEAFQSRIHIALRYRDLDSKARRIVWKTFLDMVAREEVTVSQGHDVEKKDATPTVQIEKPLRQIVSTEELDGLARRDLNGRQIKNVVRTSQALAGSMDELLAMKHLLMVLEVTEEFEHDLKGTGQIDGMMSYA